MWRWVPYPFIRITFVWIIGIVLAQYITWQLPTILLFGLGVSYGLLAFAIPKLHRYRWSSFTGFAGLLCLLAFSFHYSQYRQDDRKPHHLTQNNENFSHYVATVVADSEEKENSYSTMLNLDYVVQKDSTEKINTSYAKAKVIIYQPKSDSAIRLVYGDQILVKGKPYLVKPPTNPHEFNYKQYLASQHIYHQQYLKAGEWVLKGRGLANPILAFAYKVRAHCRQVFEQNMADKKARAIALALVLGIKSGLDDELRNAYAAAGAMHVLAVSGLHVGIIYLVLSFLLKPLTKSGKWGKVLRAILCLLALWSYALLTGLSPSVMRAASMFSFIIIAEASRRQTNIYNTIMASAFFLLLYDPFLIMSVGFQLSYLAVLGIVYLQPKIYHWFTPNNKCLDWLWGLTSVSLAAQLATFPLGLYYFQQFPLYFWLSNVLVIPAAYIILSLGIVCFLISFCFPAIIAYPTALLEQFIIYVNQGVSGIEQLPFSVLNNIYFSTEETIILYVAIICLLLLFYYRRYKFLWMFGGSLMLVFAFRLVHIHEQYQRASITFYHVSQESRIDFSSRRSTIHLGSNEPKAMYHIASNLVYKGGVNTFLEGENIQKKLAVRSWKNMELLVWKGKKIVMIKAPFDRHHTLKQTLKVDIVVICNNSVKSVETISQYFDYTDLMIDSSNAYYQAAKLAKEAEKLKIAYHCVPVQGAFEYMIE